MSDVATVEHGQELERREPASETGSLLQLIERAARDPSVDVEKMERLFAMHERMEAREAERHFNEAMHAAQAQMPQVLRDAKNETTRSTYSRLETVSKAMRPVIERHGFSLSFGTDISPQENHYRVTCKVSHTAGHSRDYHADIPSDLVGMKGNQNKTPTHAYGSTLSYGRRYLKLLIFDVATTDDDDGRAAGEGPTISEEQVAELRKLIKDFGANEQNVARKAKVEAIEQIPAAKYDALVQALNDWARQQRGM